ncbi:MAG: thiamine pyrophosphate-binding protein [Minwuiales bacterium]|nr:thiamine pyrophosphate-binding protein [Minwuiales bacterium]
MPNAADIIARRLYDAGCRTAFGIPGGEVLTLIDGLNRAGIDFILCKHENAGGFMAEGTHHVTGAPAVLVATIGPGVANAVNVVANAEQDRVPLIFLTGCVDPAEAMTYTHQVFDHGAVLRPIVKASMTAPDGAIAETIDKAVSIALDPPFGPVHIDLPIAVAASVQEDAEPPRRARAEPAAPADGDAIKAARQRLETAERPLMIAGLEVLSQGAETTVEQFARRFSMPVITTYKAKGVLPESDPLALGGAGLSPVADAHLMGLIDSSDLIVLAGYDPIEMRTGWRGCWDPAEKTVVEFTAMQNRHFMHQATMTFIGDVGAGLATLGNGATPRETWSNGAPAATRQALAESFRIDEDWGPAAICDEVRKALPANGIATVDSGAHRILLSQVWPCEQPRTLLQSTGLCTMGCALPLAIGAKLAAPDRAAVAFTGDAGLEMVLGELATLRELSLPVIVVVFVDASLALIELKQRKSGLKNVGVDYGATDFAAVADALGGVGVDVDNRADMAAAMQAALSRDTFTIIAAQLPRGAYDDRI